MTARSVFRLGITTAATAALATAFFSQREARASSMDFAPERLVRDCQPINNGGVTIPCGQAAVTGTSVSGNYFRPDNDAWAKLMSQYAVAMAPNSMRPARTTGYGGFEMSIFGQFTTISKNESFIEKGTEGPVTDAQKYTARNGSPDSTLNIYGVTGRKGLPYGFELQGTIGYMGNTEMVVLGGGVRLSPFEGFRKFFDISFGGYVHTLTGTAKVKLTVPAFDIAVSRPFVIANTVILQPYVGWQMLWINADSGVIDTTPTVDGLKNCNARPSTDAERTTGDTGEFRCQAKSGTQLTDAPSGSPESLSKLDLNNNVVFQNMRAYRRQRAMFGIAWRWENLHVVLPHIMTDLINPEDGAPDDAGKKRLAGLAKQWTFGATVGLAW
jgi:hypothetical protein